MLLESMGILIPSEAISPFAGYLVSQSRMTLFAAVAAGVLGNVVGSWIAYFIGLRGEREMWFHYGKYVGVRAHHLHIAEKWFDKYGEFTVFISRCLPVARTFISFPAGTARMNFAKFTLYTFLGCVPRVFALTYFGYILGGTGTGSAPYCATWTTRSRWRSWRAPPTCCGAGVRSAPRKPERRWPRRCAWRSVKIARWIFSNFCSSV